MMTPVIVHHRVDLAASAPADPSTVVLTGSLGSTLHMWEPQVAALSAGYRLVRFDTRGHGHSPVVDGGCTIDDLADDLLALIDRLGVERIHLVGLSLGGMTSMRLAARNPDRICSLAVLCSSTSLRPAQGWLDRAATVRRLGAQAVADTVVGRWFTPAFLEQHDHVATYRDMIASTPAEGYAACCEAIADIDLRADLSRITAPTLVLGGVQDPVTPPPELEAIAAGIANATLRWLDPAAHLASAERPEEVNAALLQHFQHIDESAGAT